MKKPIKSPKKQTANPYPQPTKTPTSAQTVIIKLNSKNVSFTVKNAFATTTNAVNKPK